MVKNESGFDMLARLIKEEGEDVRTELRLEINSGFSRVEQKLDSIETNQVSHGRDIDHLEEAVRRHDGYAKEIDHILQRTARIEKRLGIKNAASRK